MTKYAQAVLGAAVTSTMVLMTPFNASAATQQTAKVTLEFFEQKMEAVDTFNQIAKQFEKKYPNIIIKVNNVPNSNQVLASRMGSGDPPPLMTQWPPNPDYRQYVKDGLLLDLTKQNFMSNVKPSVLNSMKIDGMVYALPISLNTTGIYYNKSIFSKYGLHVPQTYAQLIQVCKTLRSKGVTPFEFPDKTSWTIGQELEYTVGLYAKNPTTIFNTVNAGKAHLTNSAVLKRVAQRMLELRNYGQPDSTGTTYQDATQAFAIGKAAMFMQGIWDMAPILQANPKINLGTFPVPAVNASDTRVIQGIDCALAVAGKSNDVADELKFVQFVAQTSTGQLYADLDHSPSAIKGVVNHTVQTQPLSKMIDEGRTFSWQDSFWTTNEANNFAAICQTLITNKDVNGFLRQMDQLFYGQSK